MSLKNTDKIVMLVGFIGILFVCLNINVKRNIKESWNTRQYWKGEYNQMMLRTTPLKIPHTLIFTYKHDILKTKQPKPFYDNIQNTISTYGNLWSETSPKVVFLSDKHCAEIIQRVFPKILQHFNREPRGMIKADICRLVALYETGGYYFDIDIQAIIPVNLSAQIEFASVQAYSPDNHPSWWTGPAIFQAFLASIPKSPILMDALEITQRYYENKLKFEGPNIGTYTLQLAYERQPSSFKQKTLLLEEILLSASTPYPTLRRRKNSGCCCNYVVHDGKNVFFWSRIIGSEHCP